MRQSIIIVGASAMGREAYIYAKECGFDVAGFLDTRSEVLAPFHGYPPVLGTVDEYRFKNTEKCVVCVGDPDVRFHYVGQLKARHASFARIVHPTAYIGMNVSIGDGSIVCPRVSITCDTNIGSHVIVNCGASINHDNKIGDFTTICPSCTLAGRVTVGRKVFLGTGTIVIPDITLGDGVVTGAGAVVTKSFNSGKLVGVPARCRQ